MTKDTALKMAIEAISRFKDDSLDDKTYFQMCKDASFACSKALEQPAQEPVLYIDQSGLAGIELSWYSKGYDDGMTEANKQTTQEPVAWIDEYKMFLEWDKETLCDKAVCKKHEAIPLYTHPKQWQGLSDDEIWDVANFLGKNKVERIKLFAQKLTNKSFGLKHFEFNDGC